MLAAAGLFLVTRSGWAALLSIVGGSVAAVALGAAYLGLRRPSVRREASQTVTEIPTAYREARNPIWTCAARPLEAKLGDPASWENSDGAIDSLSSPAQDITASAEVWLLPTARYQVRELAPLARALRAKGMSAQLVSESRVSGVFAVEAAAFGEEIAALGAQTPAPRCIVVSNDWTQAARTLRLRFPDALFVSKVEGAQDFQNVDTPRWRLPYRNSDLVLAQGLYDSNALVDVNAKVVGSSRIEQLLILAREGRVEEPVRPAVVNFNFSYGTFESVGAKWLQRVRQAHESLGLGTHISVHPAVSPEGIPTDSISRWPLALDLETSQVLVTRSSTAVFDALALGREVVYFNPHGERSWSDVRWGGGVHSATSTNELTRALRDALAASGSGFGRDFLAREFVSVDDNEDSASRGAHVIIDALDR